jgi:serine/threonine protein kinase
MAQQFGQDLILLERIAAGGMAEVYRAKQLGYAGFEKTVAVKRILPNFAENEEFKQMFRMEANLSAHLQHSNIAQVFSNGEFDSYLYLIMEFVDGKNVRQLLARADKKKARIPIELSLFIACEVAKGLQFAHNFTDEKTGEALEIVHRDMSPQNVMLSYDGAIKIVDFGIAKAAAKSGQTRAGVLKGKFGYMSPEQAQGMNIDRRTDIFAMGIILFELLTQRRLFTADDDLKTLQLVKDCKVPKPSKYNPDVSPTLDNIVLKALKRERVERYESGEEFYGELFRYLSQKYPKFLPTDLSRYLRDMFKDDIVEEKKKRDKLNAEIPARLVSASTRKKEEPKVQAERESEPQGVSGADDSPSSKTGAATVVGHNTHSTTSTTDPHGSGELPKPRSPAFQQAFEVEQNSKSLPRLNLKDMQSVAVQRQQRATTEARPLPSKSPMSDDNRSPASRIVQIGSLLVLGFVGYTYFLGGSVGPSTELPITDRIPASDTPTVIEKPDNCEEWDGEKCLKEKSLVSDPVTIKTVTPGLQSPAVPVPLEGLPTDPKKKKQGDLSIKATPQATEIELNGVVLVDSQGKALVTPLVGYKLPAGSYNLKLRNKNWKTKWEGPIVIEDLRIKALDLFLTDQDPSAH